MAPVYVYRLVPRGPFHFGERGVGIEETADIFHSDSLFSALCATVREGWGEATLAGLLAAFRDAAEPPFRLSSCFPYAGDVLFFPRPMLSPGPLDPEAAKRLKQTRFVSRALLAHWLAGEALTAELDAANFLPESQAWLSRAERERLSPLLPPAGAEGVARALWWKGEVPRVTVDRCSAASAVYRCGRLVFRADCGLYFLVEWRDTTYRDLVEEALAVLGDAGLGGRRSAGYGQFTQQPAQELDWPVPPAREAAAAADALLTLALYWPTRDELTAGVLDEPARFDLIARYGWLASPDGPMLRRREVRMIAEGSLLAPRAAVRGALAEVTPAGFTAHPVYRYGLAFPVSVRLAEESHG